MLVLALDSSTRTGSLALALDDRILESRLGDPALRQAVRLPGDLVALLAAHGYGLADVDLFAAAARARRLHRPARRAGHDAGPGDGPRPPRLPGVDARPARRGGRAPPGRTRAGSAPGCTACAARCSRRSTRATAPPRDIVAVVSPFVGTPDEAADAWRDAAPDGPIAVVGDAWPAAGQPLRDRFGAALDPGGRAGAGRGAGTACRRRTRRRRSSRPRSGRPTCGDPTRCLTRLQAGLPVSGEV